VQVPFEFRQEERPRFTLGSATLWAVLLLLLLTWLGDRAGTLLSLTKPSDQGAAEPVSQELSFRFLESPEETVEPTPDAAASDVNRSRAASDDQAKRERDPASQGSTFDLAPPLNQATAGQTLPAQPGEAQPTNNAKSARQGAEQRRKENAAEPSSLADLFSKDGPQPYRKPSPGELDASQQAAAAHLSAQASAGAAGGPRLRSYDNPDGGGADRLGFSIDTAGHDLGPYLKLLVQLVRSNWRIPAVALIDTKGIVVVRFHLHRDGRITDTTLVRLSEYEPLDASSFNAITAVHKAPPLPSHITEEWIPIHFSFYYNVRPPQ
jgi:TonB family protein